MKEIILNTVKTTAPNYRKYTTLVDDADYEKVNRHNWSTKKDGNTFYVQACIDGKWVRLHQFLTGLDLTDHKDGNGLNNQRSNLREVTHTQNAMNRRSHKNTSSKYKGVSFYKSRNKWIANIRINGKLNFIGRFNDEVEAAKAYDISAIKAFGEFAKPNFMRA